MLAPHRRSVVSSRPITIWLVAWNERHDEQAEQATGKPPGGPFVAVQYAVAVCEVRDLVQPRHSDATEPV